MVVRHGGVASWRFRRVSAAGHGEEGEEWPSASALADACRDLRRRDANRGREDRRRRLQIIRDWVLRFNVRGADGFLNGRSPGQPSKLNDAQRQAIVRMIESGPIPAVHGVVR